MIQSFENFGSSIWDILTSIISFVVSLIQGLITMIKMIPSVVSMATASVAFLPSVLVAFATLTITISIIYLIIGRQTGGQ